MCLCIWSGLCSRVRRGASGEGRGRGGCWAPGAVGGESTPQGREDHRAQGAWQPPATCETLPATSHQGTEVHQDKWGNEPSFQKRCEVSGTFLTMGVSLGQCDSGAFPGPGLLWGSLRKAGGWWHLALKQGRPFYVVRQNSVCSLSSSIHALKQIQKASIKFRRVKENYQLYR